ncbi:GLPGLI family protein [uncultured Chryseobacterium sp.]|uniref:GLPGLI family protein n=1 Tax=uncultured Chryseobacterium sp. TaxID=259322 RepID=UPI0025902724|nr:GLPGLI family protein [uncultured Chryseobacterium sp.]
MIKKNILFFSLFIVFLAQSQNLYIKYTYVNPVNFIIQEDLYVSGNRALSIRDSIMSKKDKNRLNVDGNNVGILGKATKQKTKYYKSSLDNILIINEYIGNNSYWMTDQLPKTVWNTNYKETKEVGGYLCKKATTTFRGSQMTAYYAPDLPFAFGPYKFSGLSGVILEITEDNNSVNSWKAELIETNVSEKPELTPPNKKTISYQEFIALQEEKDLEEVKRLTSNLPKGSAINIEPTERTAVEKKYEWEH